MKIARYMPFKRFCEILLHQQLPLVPLSFWNDCFESYLTQVIQTDSGTDRFKEYLVSQFDADEKQIEEAKQFLNKIKNNTRCICFSKRIDKEELWQAYSRDSMTVMIQTTYEKLQALDASGLGEVKEVHYDLSPDITTMEEFFSQLTIDKQTKKLHDSANLFAHKRPEFAYEDEVRLIRYGNNYTKDVYPLEIRDLPDFIEDVLVHPAAEDWFVFAVGILCEKFGIKYGGKSKIYTLDDETVF